MHYTGAQIIVQLLERQGITHIAGIPGGSNLPIYDALSHSHITHILTRHEQGAGFIAQGMARVSGQAAVCMASSGPGATNLITAIADAHMDSIPLVAITGQVPLAMIGTQAFQEVDTYGLMKPITKQNWLVTSVEQLLQIIPEAFRVAMSGRPGPVAIDIPKDIQQQTLEVNQWPAPAKPEPTPHIQTWDIEQLEQLISQANRPVLMLGGGVVKSNCSHAIRRFVEMTQMPTTATLMALGTIPTDHPLFLGMLGMHGARYTNLALEECDLLIGAGVRFDDRATGKVAQFCPNASIVHIDIDAKELGKLKQPHLAIHADVGEVIHALNNRILPTLGTSVAAKRSGWFKEIALLKDSFPLETFGENDIFKPYGALLETARLLDKETIITTDVGQHQMWAAQVFPLHRPRQWLTSGGLGTMGFGLPAAIGAALAQPHRLTLCISGDGSLLMNIQDIATAVEHNLNIKVLLLNNKHLGLVRQQQELFYGARYHAINHQKETDFAAIAQAMGARGYHLGKTSTPIDDLTKALALPGPCIIEVPIEAQEKVFPMVPPGAANKEMIAHFNTASKRMEPELQTMEG